MQCKGHGARVRAIEWFENDTGFASCGQDGFVFFYDLEHVRETNGTRNIDQDFS
jgi:hypothetical protein